MVCTSRETPGSLPAFDTLPKNMPDNGLSFFLIVWIMSSSFRNFSDAHDLVPISSRALQSSCVFVMPNISRSILCFKRLYSLQFHCLDSLSTYLVSDG